MKLKVMLLDDNAGRTAVLEQALRVAGYEVIARVDAGVKLIDSVAQLQPDVVIIDMASPDRDTLESMQLINRDQPRPIVMFTDNDDTEIMQSAMKAGVSAYIVDGLQAKRVKPIIDVAIARFKEFQSLRDELQKTKTIIEDRKVIDKAKLLIMKQRNLSEDEAYSILRKTAMSSNKRIVDVAREIIAVVDMLKI